MSATAGGPASEKEARISFARAVRIAALLLNGTSLLVALYFATQVRDRRDVLSAAGVVAAAALSALALAAPVVAGAESLVFRLRRIVLFVNTLLLAAALALILLETVRGWRRLALHAGLLLPPLFTIAALLSAWPFSAAVAHARRAVPVSGGRGDAADARDTAETDGSSASGGD